MDEWLEREQMSEHYYALCETRGHDDARTKLALKTCWIWGDIEELATRLLRGCTPQQLLDEVEVALELREGAARDEHKALAELFEDWRDVSPRRLDKTYLYCRPTAWHNLVVRPALSHDEVRALRMHLGLSPEAFGAQLGVSRQRVYAWESHVDGQGTNAAHPTVTALLRLFWPR